MEPIAIVRLAPGEVGFYDELTRIHLTIADPQKPVTKGMNVAGLRRSVKSKRLLLVSGSLEPETASPLPAAPPVKVAPAKQEPVAEPAKELEQAPVPEIVVEEPAVPAEEAIEEAAEPVAEAIEAAVEVAETVEEAHAKQSRKSGKGK